MPTARRLRHKPASHLARGACAVLVFSLAVGQAALAQSTMAQSASQPVAPPAPAPVETIYVVRSLRSERTPPADVCARAGPNFQPLSEDRYTLRAVTIETNEGRLTNADAGQVGDLCTCNGRTDAPDTYGFSALGHLAGLTAEGSGQCLQSYANFPEPGLSVFRCFLKLSGLPPEFAGGMLTSNTVGSKALAGPQSDPPGYLQLSIATIRIWRKRGS